jgi:hypothetical protein
MQGLSDRLTRVEMALVGIMAWKLWDRRNDFLHKELFAPPSQIVKAANLLLSSLNLVNGDQAKLGEEIPRLECSRGRGSSKKWRAPPFGRYKVN